MKKIMTTTGDMKIALEEDLLTLDANTGEKFYRPFTPEDYQRFEAETIHVREEAQRAIDETQWDTGEPGAFFKVLHHTNCILRTRLVHYRNQVKDFRARAYVAENGGYPPTQNGDIRSLFWLFSLMALQN